jgi:ectoine hydroxylase-related dioxygenase (phytanoyl-CoA dioxygenase family)
LPPIDKSNGVQVRARAGDVIFAHYLLAHTIASNVSANIRYALYFRVSVPNLGKGTDKYEMYRNLWTDWPGLPK